jgi:hypothetical protein
VLKWIDSCQGSNSGKHSEIKVFTTGSPRFQSLRAAACTPWMPLTVDGM